MMSMLQNAFSNSSSSLIQSKMQGNIVFVLLPPLSYLEFFLAYLGAAVIRGLVVGLGVWAVTLWFAPVADAASGLVVAYALLACAIMARSASWRHLAEKYDQTGGIPELPHFAAHLPVRVFYSIHSLAALLAGRLARQPGVLPDRRLPPCLCRPVDTDPWLGLLVAGACFVAISALTLALLKSGYKLRH